MQLTKIAITIIATVVFSHAVSAAPKWSLELKGGQFRPEDTRLSEFYTGDHTANAGLAVGFNFLRFFEIGLEGAYLRDTGQGYQPLHDQKIGTVIFSRFPLSFFMLLRGRLYANQIVVPYAGGGWTRLQYIQTIADQETFTGSTDGTHFRAGLQLLLDRLDRGRARKFEKEYGIENTYLFFEYHSISSKKESVNVDFSGVSYQMGILMEF